MEQKEKVGAAIEAAGLSVQYDRGFLVFTSTDQRTGDFEEERAVIEQLGASMNAVRGLAITGARAARGSELIGERMLIPVIGIGEPKRGERTGRIVRSQVSGKLIGVNREKGLEATYAETSGDDSFAVKSEKAFDECFVIVAGDPSDRAHSISSGTGDNIASAIADGDLRRALDLASSVGIAIEHDAGLAIVKWNVPPEENERAEEILLKFGPPRGDLACVLETRARVAAGADFLGRAIFAPDPGTFGILEAIESDCCIMASPNETDARLFRVNGDAIMILPGDFEKRQAEAQPQKTERSWRSLLPRALGGRR